MPPKSGRTIPWRAIRTSRKKVSPADQAELYESSLLGSALRRAEGAVLLEDRDRHARELALVALGFPDVDADDFSLLGIGLHARHDELGSLGEHGATEFQLGPEHDRAADRAVRPRDFVRRESEEERLDGDVAHKALLPARLAKVELDDFAVLGLLDAIGFMNAPAP